jgi:acyl-CoA dehydrogenase
VPAIPPSSNKGIFVATIVDDASLATLRAEVRDFLRTERDAGTYRPICDCWLEGHDPAFSRKLGERGWLGMTWPREYGGHERSSLERFVVTEELLAAGAPVAAHWVADRQTGPLLLRYGTEEQRRQYLSGIAAGELFVAIGMSEPDSGSDLASIRSSAQKVEGGWLVNGTKVWTSHAHRSDVLVALVRTSKAGSDRHAGLSQLLIPLDADGITVSPIEVMTGEAHFAEVALNDVFVADAQVVGAVGDGWQQVTSELAYERSGPERFMSTYPLFDALVSEVDEAADDDLGAVIGQMWALHLLSEDVNRSIEAGTADPATPALVKDAGTRLEGEIIEVARSAMSHLGDPSTELRRLFREASLAAPAFTLRGGTNEILRTIIAKSWGTSRA